MMVRSALALAASLALAGCVYIDAEEAGKGLTVAHAPTKAEGIYGAEVKGRTLLVRVASNGCTEAASFDPDVDEHDDGHYSLKLRRKKEDVCKAFLPDGVEVSFSLEALGIAEGAKVTLENPLIVR